MTKEFLLVDGYNIINAWPHLNEAKNISLEIAREKLIEIMADYAAQAGVAVIVVFDAHQVETTQRYNYIKDGVRVVFTKQGETADHFIEKVADAMGREEKVVVATSDWIEQQIVMGRGATRISARELLIEVENMTEKRRVFQKRRKQKRETLEDIIDPITKEMLRKRIIDDNYDDNYNDKGHKA